MGPGFDAGISTYKGLIMNNNTGGEPYSPFDVSQHFRATDVLFVKEITDERDKALAKVKELEAKCERIAKLYDDLWDEMIDKRF